jgi:hypothetical protein
MQQRAAKFAALLSFTKTVVASVKENRFFASLGMTGASGWSSGRND